MVDTAYAVLGGMLVMLILLLGSVVRAAADRERVGAGSVQTSEQEQLVAWCAGRFGPLDAAELKQCAVWVRGDEITRGQ